MEKSDIDEGADLEAYLFHRHSRRDTSRGIARDLTIRTDDGASLAATVFESPHASSRVPPAADPHASSRVPRARTAGRRRGG
ncbi:MAG: hypothetical protein JST00_27835 [Deltaproteobacteria bacterium]|nr:hypothetical protein [Deltaproteobacteria bacterium]